MNSLINSVKEGNLIQWDPKKIPFYEIYYLKVVGPGAPRSMTLGSVTPGAEALWSFWARYTVLVPQKEPGNASAAVWGIFFKPGQKGAPREVCVLKKTFRLNEIDLFHAERFIQIVDNFLSLDSARGALADSEHQIQWDLRFEDPTISFSLYPCKFLYSLPFPKTKYLEPRLSTFLSGTLTIDHDIYRLEHVKAHQAHLWGTQYAKRWVWGHCNSFVEDESAIFEGLTVQIPIGPLTSPPLSLFVFFVDGGEYRANGILQWFKNKSSHTLLEWKFSAVCGDRKFVGLLHRKEEDILGVEYAGPHGEKRFCHSAMISTLELKVYKKEEKKWRLLKTLASKEAAFETVEPKPDPKVHFVL